MSADGFWEDVFLISGYPRISAANAFLKFPVGLKPVPQKNPRHATDRGRGFFNRVRDDQMFLVVVVIVVMIAMSAALAGLFELMAFLFRLPAVLAMSADGLVQGLFGIVDLPLALSVPVPVIGVHGQGAAQQQEPAQQGGQNSGLFKVHVIIILSCAARARPKSTDNRIGMICRNEQTECYQIMMRVRALSMAGRAGNGWLTGHAPEAKPGPVPGQAFLFLPGVASAFRRFPAITWLRRRLKSPCSRGIHSPWAVRFLCSSGNGPHP
jgi:hypothetical protein